MYKAILGLIVTSLFSAASANACIGRLSDDDRSKLDQKVLDAIEELVSAKEILFSDSNIDREIIGSKGNCQAVYQQRTDVVVYTIDGESKPVCKSTVTTLISEGQPGQDDQFKQDVVRTSGCKDTKDL